MGIRYYAYAFESHETEAATADPMRFISDPLAGVWADETGLHPRGCDVKEPAPDRESLYLDKAWRCLQHLTEAPAPVTGQSRAAHRMFEGDALHTARGPVPWLRCIKPAEVVSIARDLESISEIDVELEAERCDSSGSRYEGAQAYVLQYFREARDFAVRAAAAGRGLVYVIG